MQPPLPDAFRHFERTVMCMRCSRKWRIVSWTQSSREFLLQHDADCLKHQQRRKRHEYVLDHEYDRLLDRRYTSRRR